MSTDRYELAEALVAAQRWDSARDTLGAQLARSPDDPRLLGLLVRTLRAQGARKEALDTSRTLLSVTPADPYALRLATLVLLDVGWIDEAIALAGRAVESDPTNAANHLALSRAWGSSSRPEAIAHQLTAAREAVLLEPNSVDAQLQIGVALAAEGDPDAAREAYREALRRDPGNTAALNNLAVLEMAAGSPADAARWLAEALAQDPQGRSARHNLDALAVLVARRAAAWLLVAPLPALVAAGAGLPVLARVLAGLAAVGVPLVGLRWWRALTTGQRRALRGLPSRLRRRTWIWPIIATVAGGWALLRAAVTPDSVSTVEVVGYGLVVTYLWLLRALTGTPDRVLRARARGASPGTAGVLSAE